MNKMFGSAVVALMLVFSVGASAEFSRADWRHPGDNTLIRDTNSGLEWIDLSETAGRSYMDVVSEMGGGTFDGWRVASGRDVRLLLEGLLGIRIGTQTSVVTMASRDSLFNLFLYPFESEDVNYATDIITLYKGYRGLYSGGLYYYDVRLVETFEETFEGEIRTFEYRAFESSIPLANDRVTFNDLGVFLVRDFVSPPADIVDVGAPIMGAMSFLMLIAGFRRRC
jgi:hypothetical protein